MGKVINISGLIRTAKVGTKIIEQYEELAERGWSISVTDQGPDKKTGRWKGIMRFQREEIPVCADSPLAFAEVAISAAKNWEQDTAECPV